ncbi:MAG: hypothetical protein ABJL72_08390 [Roseobacter sp.]
MPLIRINATPDGLILHDTPQPAVRRLCSMASRPGPAIIMVHGYKYAPGTASHCPHKKIFGSEAHSWPTQLGFDGKTPDEGLGIALGWHARGSLKAMHKRAAELGEHIAVIVAMLRSHTPNRPIHIIAHSLGSEATLNALLHLPQGAINRMILLTGASFADHAEKILKTPAGRSIEVLNVTSRENDLFDAGFERLIRPSLPDDHAIGQGISAPNVATLQLDCQTTMQNLGRLGFPVEPSQKRICHWSCYKRSGVMQIYSAFLRTPGVLPFDMLRSILPEQAAPRWSRFFARHHVTAQHNTRKQPAF